VDIDINLEMGPSVFASLQKDEATISLDAPMIPLVNPIAAKSQTRDFSPSVSSTLRSINSKELLDVRQQADFFMTLGQYEDAINLLEDNIQASGDSNPLVYLDLLRIFHTLSRKDDYDHCRQEFNQLFTGEVPQYVTFHQSGKHLEQYPEVCGQICLAWNTSNILEVIESFLVRKQGSDNLWEFDLEAYRDLLMLHGIASRLEMTSESLLVPFTAARLPVYGNDTSPQPVVAEQSHEVDFDLSGESHNLIDFEVSGFSSAGSVLPRKN
jgi:tetratricopeptide (TPR) repeat protein